MHRAEKDVFAAIERPDEGVVPVVERDGETGDGGSWEPVRSHSEQRLLARELQQTDRTSDAEGLAQPLQRVLRAVSELIPAHKGFEQPHALREHLVLVDGHSGRRYAFGPRGTR